MIKAIGDRIFIRLDKDTDNSANKIIMDTKYYPRCIGKIESIGNLVTSVKTGDHVLFHVFDELPTADKDLVVVRESSILGVFNDE